MVGATRDRRSWASRLVVLVVLAAGCGADEPPVQDCRRDCPTAQGETCGGCYANVSTCCYGDDPVHAEMLDHAQRVCELDPGCVACCDECADLTCEALIARGGCPAVTVQ